MGHGIRSALRLANTRSTRAMSSSIFSMAEGSMTNESLARFVKKGTLSEEESKEVLCRIHPTLDLDEVVQNADFGIEVVTRRPY